MFYLENSLSHWFILKTIMNLLMLLILGVLDSFLYEKRMNFTKLGLKKKNKKTQIIFPILCLSSWYLIVFAGQREGKKKWSFVCHFCHEVNPKGKKEAFWNTILMLEMEGWWFVIWVEGHYRNRGKKQVYCALHTPWKFPIKQ